MSARGVLCFALASVFSGCPTDPSQHDAASDEVADAPHDALVLDAPNEGEIADAVVPRDAGMPSNGCGHDASASTRDAGADIDPPAPSAYPRPITHRAAQRTFAKAELGRACPGGYLHGGPTDRNRHNGVFVSDSLLVMPGAHQDGGAVRGQATAAMPQAVAPDAVLPRVNMIVPRDGETNVGLLARIGLTLSDFVDVASVHPGSFFVRPIGARTPLEGTDSGQEGAIHFNPREPLAPGTRYEVVVAPRKPTPSASRTIRAADTPSSRSGTRARSR